MSQVFEQGACPLFPVLMGQETAKNQDRGATPTGQTSRRFSWAGPPSSNLLRGFLTCILYLEGKTVKVNATLQVVAYYKMSLVEVIFELLGGEGHSGR